jgi:hypothetical protein
MPETYIPPAHVADVQGYPGNQEEGQDGEGKDAECVDGDAHQDEEHFKDEEQGGFHGFFVFIASRFYEEAISSQHDNSKLCHRTKNAQYYDCCHCKTIVFSFFEAGRSKLLLPKKFNPVWFSIMIFRNISHTNLPNRD